MLRKRRVSPASSRKWGFKSGNCESSSENSSLRLAAEQTTRGVPAVSRRKAVGISIVMLIERPPNKKYEKARSLVVGRSRTTTQLPELLANSERPTTNDERPSPNRHCRRCRLLECLRQTG